MKQFLTLLLAGFLFHSISAQSQLSNSDKIRLHRSFVSNLLQGQSAGLSAMYKVDSVRSYTAYRVVSQSTHDNTLVSISDSVKVAYGAKGSSTYDYNMMLYAYNYPYNTSPLFSFQGIFSKPQITSDNYMHWQIDPNTLLYGFWEKDNAAYDTLKNMVRDTAWFADSAVYSNMLHLNKFNAANLIQSSYSYKYHGGIVDSAFKQYFVYNAANKLIQDSMYEFHAGSWHVVSRTLYTYDGSNNLTQIDNFSNVSDTTFLLPLIEQLKYMNTYDGSNRLITAQTSFYDGTVLKPYVKDTFGYTGSLAFHSSWREHQFDGINLRWEPMSWMTKHINPSGLPDTINIQGFDRIDSIWTPAAMWICRYDSVNNPIKLFDFEYNFTAFPPTPDFTTFYYYEAYTVDTGTNPDPLPNSINRINATENDIMIYPNPTNAFISLTGFGEKTAIVKVSIFDLTGRIFSNRDLIVRNGQSQLSLADLVPGNYMIVIEDETGSILHRQVVVKE